LFPLLSLIYFFHTPLLESITKKREKERKEKEKRKEVKKYKEIQV